MGVRTVDAGKKGKKTPPISDGMRGSARPRHAMPLQICDFKRFPSLLLESHALFVSIRQGLKGGGVYKGGRVLTELPSYRVTGGIIRLGKGIIDKWQGKVFE